MKKYALNKLEQKKLLETFEEKKNLEVSWKQKKKKRSFWKSKKKFQKLKDVGWENKK